MDYFIEIIKILFSSWPIAFLIFIFLFRKEISVLISEIGEMSTKWFSFKRYGKFHVEGTGVIKETYKNISKTYIALESLIAPMQWVGEKSIIEKRKDFVDIANNFLQYFQENKIFFSQNLSSDINKLSEEFKEVYNKWNLSQVSGVNGRHNLEDWNKAWEQLKTDVSQTKVEIENKFRKIIGTE